MLRAPMTTMMDPIARWAALVSAAALFMTSAAACEEGPAPSGSGEACGSCAEAVADGTIPCGDTASSDAYDALLACACDECAFECNVSLCSALPSDAACGDCLGEKCEEPQTACAER